MSRYEKKIISIESWVHPDDEGTAVFLMCEVSPMVGHMRFQVAVNAPSGPIRADYQGFADACAGFDEHVKAYGG